eukprot:4740434-Pleurochrysis_carterae.AAC.1
MEGEADGRVRRGGGMREQALAGPASSQVATSYGRLWTGRTGRWGVAFSPDELVRLLEKGDGFADLLRPVSA